MFFTQCSILQNNFYDISLFNNFDAVCYLNYTFLIIFKIILKLTIFCIILFVLYFAAPLIKELLSANKIIDQNNERIQISPFFEANDIKNYYFIFVFLISNLLLLLCKKYDSYFLIKIINTEETKLLKFLYFNIKNIYNNIGFTINSLTNKYKKYFLKFHENLQKIIANIIISIILTTYFLLMKNIENYDSYVYLLPITYQIILLCRFCFSLLQFYEFITDLKFSDSDLIKDFNRIKEKISCNFSLKNISNSIILLFMLIKFSNVLKNKTGIKFISNEASSFMLAFILCCLFEDQKLFSFDSNMSDFAKYSELYIGLKHTIKNLKLSTYSENDNLIVNEEDDIYIKNLEFSENIWDKNHFQTIDSGHLENFRFKNIVINNEFYKFINHILGMHFQIPKRAIYVNEQDLSQNNIGQHVLFLDKNFTFFNQDESIVDNLLFLFPESSKEIIEEYSKQYLPAADINLPYSYLSSEEKEISLIILSKISKIKEKYFLLTNSIKCFEFFKDIPIKIYLTDNFNKLPKGLTVKDCYEWRCRSLNKLEE